MNREEIIKLIQRLNKDLECSDALAFKPGVSVGMELLAAIDGLDKILHNGVTDMNEIRPDHYKGENGKDLFWFYETYLPREWVTGFYMCNIIKYVIRHQKKNGLQDLDKAGTYLKRLEELEVKNDGIN